MFKKVALFVIVVFNGYASFAQSAADSVYNQYLDFNMARFQGEQDKVMDLGEKLLPKADKLNEKARTNFYFGIGKMYEDNDDYKKAIFYYSKVETAVPDYYVVHRALGYLYLIDVKTIKDKLNASANDAGAVANLTLTYNDAIRKSLPQLEKAQACDPSDETLIIIKSLYKELNDEKGLSSLDSRLKQLSIHCIDILSDQ